MRKLMWFVLGFAAACLPCAYLWLMEELRTLMLICTVLFGLVLVMSRHVKWLRCIAVTLLGCAVGFLWFHFYAQFYLSDVSYLDGKEGYISGYCTDYGYETDYGTAVETVIKVSGKPVRAKLYLDEQKELEPGDLIRGKVRFRITTPDGADESTAHSGKGIFLLIYQEDAMEVRLSEDQLWTMPARLRHKLLGILEQFFPADTSAFAKALLLGERTDIDYATNTAFKLSGISHIIAVSGLHVTILFTLINLLCLKRRALVALFGIPSLLLFAAVAGFSPSITRACIMQSLMIMAALLNKEYDGPTELAFSCLVMLLINPLVITSVSFQLSVGCMIGIFLFHARLREYFADRFMGKGKSFAKLRRWVIASVSVTLSAMAVTTPLVALYFGTVSLVGILTNLLTLWVISFIFNGLILVCIFGMFWPAAATIIAAFVAWPIRYVLIVAKKLAAFPLSAVYTASTYVVIWLVFCYVMLAVFLITKKKEPAVFGCCAVVGLCIALCASWLEPTMDTCRVTVLDVGQGQCILLQSEGKNYLVDCGSSNGAEAADTAAELLISQGVSYLDGAILTHFDADHASGMEYLLSRIPTEVLFVPASTDEENLTQRLSQHAIRTNELTGNVILTYENTKLSIFGPIVPNSGNESSLAILLQSKEYDILITGDRSGFGERLLLKTAQIPKVDVLVVGHHGSKTSTCEELLTAVKPEVAVISVGENRFGHPAQEVLDRLAASGCVVYRTDLNGNIVLRR